jgi:hypothetical protein
MCLRTSKNLSSPIHVGASRTSSRNPRGLCLYPLCPRDQPSELESLFPGILRPQYQGAVHYERRCIVDGIGREGEHHLLSLEVEPVRELPITYAFLLRDEPSPEPPMIAPAVVNMVIADMKPTSLSAKGSMALPPSAAPTLPLQYLPSTSTGSPTSLTASLSALAPSMPSVT